MGQVISLSKRLTWQKARSKYSSPKRLSRMSQNWIQHHSPFRFRILESGALVLEHDDWSSVPEYVWQDLLNAYIKFADKDLVGVGKPMKLRCWLDGHDAQGRPVFTRAEDCPYIPTDAYRFVVYVSETRNNAASEDMLIWSLPLYDERQRSRGENACG